MQPAKKTLRQMGYLADQQGILNRFINQRGGWNEHLNLTKNYILKSTANYQKNTLIVLGSGWLLDFPLTELANIFKKIILIDIIHPRPVIQKTKLFNNVNLITDDITGAVEQVYYACKNKTPLSTIKLNSYQFPEEPSLVISLNILSQLTELLKEYIENTTEYKQNEIIEFCKNIQQQHIHSLPQNHSILISDIEEKHYDNKTKLINTKSELYINLPVNKTYEEWDWKFDFTNTYLKNINVINKVIAINL